MDLGHSYQAEAQYHLSEEGNFKIWYVTTPDDRPGAGWRPLSRWRYDRAGSLHSCDRKGCEGEE